jgi:hypothetical protein
MPVPVAEKKFSKNSAPSGGVRRGHRRHALHDVMQLRYGELRRAQAVDADFTGGRPQHKITPSESPTHPRVQDLPPGLRGSNWLWRRRRRR